MSTRALIYDDEIRLAAFTRLPRRQRIAEEPQEQAVDHALLGQAREDHHCGAPSRQKGWFARVGNAVTGGRPKCSQFLPNFSRCPHSRFVPNSK